MKAKRTTEPREPIRILHLSDIHFRGKTEWDQRPVLRGLTETVEKLAPDLIAISGDVAYAGDDEEYELARAWINKGLLKALPDDFRRSRILLVPGNHDVDRSAVKKAAQGLQDLLLKQQSQGPLAETLEDPGERDVLLRRHTAYLRFANNYRSAKKKLEVPWWSEVYDIKNSRVHVAGLCSSWMSWSDQDRGNLLIGRWQVNDALINNAPDNVDFRIVMVHHPWDYLAEFDARDIQKDIQAQAHLILRGHLHRQKSQAVSYPYNGCLELEAGCVYEGTDSPNPKAFQLVEVDRWRQHVVVQYWTWQDRKWMPDGNVVPGPKKVWAKFRWTKGGAWSVGAPPGSQGGLT